MIGGFHEFDPSDGDRGLDDRRRPVVSPASSQKRKPGKRPGLRSIFKASD